MGAGGRAVEEKQIKMEMVVVVVVRERESCSS